MLKDAPIIPYIPVTDLARARKFYSEKVGLEPKEEANGGLTYECGGAPIFMYVSGGAGTSKASQAFWAVKDLRAEMAELRARGLKFEQYDMPGMTMKDGIAEGGGALAAWFIDSEGNTMALVQSL
ncbi:MAG: VOC family protein [Gemmatimonadaceae bacterium]